MRILITGAFGRLGQTCIKQALVQGYEVSTFDIDSPNNRKAAAAINHTQALRCFWGDIRNPADIKQALEDVDAVLHHAAVLPPVTDKAPELAYSINVKGTELLIEAIQQLKRKITLLYPSSLTVFGNKQNMPPPRTTQETTQASDNYTDHKLQCEQAINNSTLPFVIFRVGVSVGAELQSTDKKTLAAMLSVKANNRLEYVHPEDVALAMINAIGNTASHGKTLLLGGGKQCQVYQRDLINATLGAAGLRFEDHELGTEDYYTDWLDTSESQALLKYQTINFEQFQQQMYHKLRFIRPLIKPFSPLIKVLLKRWLQL
jgi:nucleoside-diphosphate-sugar epimerase